MAQTKKMIADGIRANRRELNQWFLEKAKIHPPLFYGSVDLRDSGYKIVPVDFNLFPAGFNNICPDDQRTAPPILRAHLDAELTHAGISDSRKLLILPENHTTNLYYLDNLVVLKRLVEEAGFEVKLGWHTKPGETPPTEPFQLKSQSGDAVELLPIVIENDQMRVGDFVPDLVLVNNDFSSGEPTHFRSIKQPLIPNPFMGWHHRKKSDHFVHYNALAAEFAKIAGFDPWLIQVDTVEVSPVNFNEEVGITETRDAAAAMMARIQKDYEARGITRKPFIFIKNNSGTYGMGIMVIHDSADLDAINRRTKNKMSVGKNRLQISSMCIQEGVPTATLVDRLPAEPVIYLSGSELIGGFLRTNTERGDEDNLNSQGMVFRKLCMADLRAYDPEETTEEEPLMELVYGTVARLSALATGKELWTLQQKEVG